MEKIIGREESVHLVYVDLQKPYDTVALRKLWSRMKLNGISQVYINAGRNLYIECSCTVKIGNKVSQKFSASKALRQGCTLAPLLFKIYLEEEM